MNFKMRGGKRESLHNQGMVVLKKKGVGLYKNSWGHRGGSGG